jgi:hypothetical protein
MMKKVLKMMMAGVMCIAGSAVCRAQLQVNANTSYTIPNVVAATGASQYQWYVNGTLIPGATAADYTNAAGMSIGGKFTYVRKAYIADCGWVSSNPYTVVVNGMKGPEETVRTANVVCVSSLYGNGNQCWSDAVKITTGTKQCTYSANPIYCDRTCANNLLSVVYSRTYIDQNKDAMCLSPWRVPTLTDFQVLQTIVKELYPVDADAVAFLKENIVTVGAENYNGGGCCDCHYSLRGLSGSFISCTSGTLAISTKNDNYCYMTKCVQ